MDFSASFPGTPAGARAARYFVRDALIGSDPQLCDTVLLLTSEVVTNAALHTGSRFVVGVAALANGDVRVSVTDDSTQALPQAALAPLDATSGRGLNVVEALASAWGVDHHRHSKVVWFEARPGQPST